MYPANVCCGNNTKPRLLGGIFHAWEGIMFNVVSTTTQPLIWHDTLQQTNIAMENGPFM